MAGLMKRRRVKKASDDERMSKSRWMIAASREALLSGLSGVAADGISALRGGILFTAVHNCSPLPAFLENFLISRNSGNHEGAPHVQGFQFPPSPELPSPKGSYGGTSRRDKPDSKLGKGPEIGSRKLVKVAKSYIKLLKVGSPNFFNLQGCARWREIKGRPLVIEWQRLASKTWNRRQLNARLYAYCGVFFLGALFFAKGRGWNTDRKRRTSNTEWKAQRKTAEDDDPPSPRRLCENSELAILENEKEVQSTLANKRNASRAKCVRPFFRALPSLGVFTQPPRLRRTGEDDYEHDLERARRRDAALHGRLEALRHKRRHILHFYKTIRCERMMS
jgi:hypothetical protein